VLNQLLALGDPGRSSIGRHSLQYPYQPPQEYSAHRSCHAWCIALAVFACLIGWPLAVIVGWCIGDRNQVVLLDSMWTGLFPITNSPGFGLIVLTLPLYLVGIVTMFIRPRKKRGYLITIGSAMIAGMLSFLLAFAINTI
jgi:hypothetical protein